MTASHEDFQSESVDLCKTPEELVKSPLFLKALEKNLEPADVQFIQAIVANRLNNKELTIREKKYLDGLEQDNSLISQFNEIINTIEYISKKKGSQMADKQELPHFDDTGKADAKKVIAWLRGENKEKVEEKTPEEILLSKDNQTPKDRKGMEAAIKELKDLNMRNEKNINLMIGMVSYGVENGKEYVNVGTTKRTKEDIKAKADKKNIYQHGDTTYFKRSEKMIEEQNKLLDAQGMKIPEDSYFEDSLKSLPGEYKKGEYYNGGNILALITGMSMSGYCDSDGKLNSKGIYGYRWSASSKDKNNAQYFRFSKDEGILTRRHRDLALPVRPVLK